MMKLIFITNIILFNIIAFSQENILKGKLQGKVIDKETLQPINKATIILTNTKLGALTDSQGNFVINDIQIGRYSVAVRIAGYIPEVQSDVIITSNRNTNINFELKMVSYEADEVMVKAEYFNDDSKLSKVAISEIDGQELKSTPGMPDLFRRLQLVPGVGMTDESSSQLIVRGGDPDENLTLIENMEILSPFHFSSMGSEVSGSMSIIDPKLIEKVSMSTGGFYAKYGDKMSAITDIKIKEADKNKFTSDLTFDLSGLSADFGMPIADNFNIMLSGRRGILDLIMGMMDKDFLPRTYDFQTKIVWDINEKNKLWFYGIYSSDIMKGNSTEDVEDEAIYSDINKTTATYGFNWQYLLSNDAYLLITPYINSNNWSMFTGPLDNQHANFYKNNEFTSNVKSELFYKLNHNNKFTIGTEFKTLNAEYQKLTDNDTLNNGSFIPAQNLIFNSDLSYKISLNLNYNFTLNNILDFNCGLRTDHFTFIDKSLLSPRFSINYILSEDLNLAFSTGIYYQFPQFYKIFSDKENRKLNPAKSEHYILAINYKIFDDTQICLEAYYKNYSQLSVLLNDSSNIYKSTGSGNSLGFDICLTKRMSDNLYFMINYSFSQTKRKDNQESNEYYFRYDKPHSLNMMLTYTLGDWWNIGSTLSYSTGYPFTPFDLNTRRQINGIWYCDYGEKNSERYPDYLRIDLRIERRFVFQNLNLKLYLELWNISNNENVFEYDYSNDFLNRKSDVLFSFMPVIGIGVEL